MGRFGLNVVRSGRPEQYPAMATKAVLGAKSQCSPVWKTGTMADLYELIPVRCVSQCSPVWKTGTISLAAECSLSKICLNVVRSGRPEQFGTFLALKWFLPSLNVVRSGRPEQSAAENEENRNRRGVSM